ncbi:MAG: aminotransferase class III-fold pyridoxal phosphate-dependent enzyme, partial [Candidatus Binatia bacterium]
MTGQVDWEKIKEWDEKYCLHARYTRNEYHSSPIVGGQGSYIHLADGTKILDFLSGYVSVNIGYNHPKVQAAIKNAADEASFVADHAFCTEHKAKLAKMLMEDILGPDDWAGGIRFCVTGSEANELAFMLAKLYTDRPLIVTREFSYHGWTMGAVGATTLRGYRSTLSDETDPTWVRDVPSHPGGGFMLVPGTNCYRCSLGHEYPGCKNRRTGELPCISIIRSLIQSRGPENVAAIITETSQGAGNI